MKRLQPTDTIPAFNAPPTSGFECPKGQRGQRAQRMDGYWENASVLPLPLHLPFDGTSVHSFPSRNQLNWWERSMRLAAQSPAPFLELVGQNAGELPLRSSSDGQFSRGVSGEQSVVTASTTSRSSRPPQPCSIDFRASTGGPDDARRPCVRHRVPSDIERDVGRQRWIPKRRVHG
jgi:hypothetical protein